MADHKLSREAINAYADLSHDHNPLHVDEAAAAASPFGGVVAHGFLLLGGALTELGGVGGYPKRLECRFLAPGRPGDILTTEMDADGGFRVRCGERELVSGRLATGAHRANDG